MSLASTIPLPSCRVAEFWRLAGGRAGSVTDTGCVIEGSTVKVDSTMTTWPLEVRVDVSMITFGVVGGGAVGFAGLVV